MTRLFCSLVCLLSSLSTLSQEMPIELHDNTVTSGILSGNTLTIDLVVGSGMWYPGGEERPGAPMSAIGESGGLLQAPGPLLRVPQGTEVRANVHNSLSDQSLYFHGFHDRPNADSDAVFIDSGVTREFSFRLDSPGVYYYWADSLGSDLALHNGLNTLLSGAIVVDPPDEKIPGRFFVIGEGFPVPGKREHSFNARSFPFTEKMTVTVGEESTWHFINTSFAGHPLHLHGTFFQVTHRGSISEYQMLNSEQLHEEVTATVAAGEVMTMQWHTDRPGNWLFHCHISAHVTADSGRLSSGDNFQMDHDAPGLHEMAGMTLAITARSSAAARVEPPPAREIAMLLETLPEYTRDNSGYGTSFNALGSGSIAPIAPGPVLVLKQDEPVSIELTNNLPEITSIHWHGMELQSYYDGVAGFSGVVGSVTPAIAPGESFVIRMTPPRAGTYIYHTHMDDRSQLIKGLYGALIVESAEYPYDPAIDKIFVMGLSGDADRIGARVEGMVINGTQNPVMELAGIKQYRLRLINITANNSELEVSLVSSNEEQQWTSIGKDGMQLPERQQVESIADRHPVSVGETYDFAWTPPAAGTYWLEIRRSSGEWMGQAMLNVLPN